MDLETRLPPLNVAWLFQSAALTAADVLAVEDTIARFRASSPHYLDDVISVVARIRARDGDRTFPLPPPGNHVDDVTNADLDNLGNRITHCAYARDASSLYVYACQIRMPPAVERIDEKEFTANQVKGIMLGFSKECKFKKTNDLFIHAIIKLKLPAWLTAGMCRHDTPYTAAGRVLGDDTNAVVRPLVQTQADVLLTTLPTHEQFCIWAATAIELCNTAPVIAINTSILMVPDDQPTLAAMINTWECEAGRIGYVHNRVFYEHSNPFVVICAWAVACDASSSLSKAATGADMFLNPLRKYL